MVEAKATEETHTIWDEPVRCAQFIEKFTTRLFTDIQWYELEQFSRNDLEGIIQLLHGYYSYFISDAPPEIRKSLTCTAEDVLNAMAMATQISNSENGEIILKDELWEIVKEDPVLLKYFTSLENKITNNPSSPR